MATQSPEDVFAPLRSLASRGGGLFLAGTDLTSATILHLAEEQADLRLLVRWAYGRDGRTIAVRHGGCSRGFERLSDLLAAIQRDVSVGDSHWRVFDAAELLNLATAAFRRDPSVGTCANAACCRCRQQVAFAAARGW